MTAAAERMECFPVARLPHLGGGRHIEVALIAQLGIGAGDHLINRVGDRQRRHDGFVDALDEPSVRLGAMSLAHGDASTLYSFVVGPEGHPFHRHAGDRTFTAVSGSAGVRLRFSTASPQQMDADPEAFVRALRHVTIPPDCVFTVRFGGGTWHRFEPLRRSGHPALFALSCHPNELGGDLDPAMRARVEADAADLATLTEVLPAASAARLAQVDVRDVPTVALSLHEAPDSTMAKLCAIARDVAGRWRSIATRLRPATGFRFRAGAWPRTAPLPQESLLATEFADAATHTDCVAVAVPAEVAASLDDEMLLAAILDGFLANRPRTIGWMMATRNTLVAPWRLRTSPIGCPVSSLLGTGPCPRFAGRFPVLAARVVPGVAEVLLGADDRHLRFRSVVGVRRDRSGGATAWLGTRVRTMNAFGRCYLAAIDAVHRRYIAPRLLQAAVEHVARAGR